MPVTDAYIPENLDLDQLLVIHPPAFTFSPCEFRYIVSLLTEIPAFNKDILDYNGLVPIHTPTLQKKIHDYAHHLRYLQEHKVIWTDGHYIPGLRSRGWRLYPAYCTDLRVEPIVLPRLVKHLTAGAKKDEASAIQLPYLHKWYNDKLTLDYDAALAYMKWCFENPEPEDKNPYLQYHSNKRNLDRIHNRDFFFTVDDNVGRLHTPLTVMKSELRNFLTYDGQKLVAVDIRNSQPVFSTRLLSSDFYKKAQTKVCKCNGLSSCCELPYCGLLNLYDFNDKSQLFKWLFKQSRLREAAAYIMLVNERFAPYITSSSRGQLYEDIERELLRVGISVGSRKELKAVVFVVLFTDNRYFGQDDARPKRLFQQLFPEVYKVFCMLKRNDKTTLPRLLQTMESKVMLDRIAKRISVERPDLPIYTIHDSVATTVGDEDYVAKVMKEEIKRAIGVTPTMKPEYWSPDKLA